MNTRLIRVLAVVAVAAPLAVVGSPSRAQPGGAGCPNALAPGSGSAPAKGVVAAVARDVPRLYAQPEYRRYEVTALTSLAPRAFVPSGVQPYRGIALRRCGARVVGRSWVVFLYFPRLAASASLSQGVVYAARTPNGWRLWYRYR